MIDDDDRCLGYSTFNGESTEYECGHEFGGDVACEDCIYGPYNGKVDPRIDCDIEEDEGDE